MYFFLNIKHNILSLWLLIGLSLTFGYETHLQLSSQHQVELIDVQTSTKTSGVPYIPLVQQAKKVGYIPSFIAFSFENLLQKQHTNIRSTLIVQETSIHKTQYTVVIDYLQQHAILSDDTDTAYTSVILS